MKKDVVSKVWQLIFLLALSIPMSGFAQAIQVKGTVLDASGMTVIGASVLEKEQPMESSPTWMVTLN